MKKSEGYVEKLQTIDRGEKQFSDSNIAKLIFIIITLVAAPIHEFGHFIGYKLSGIPSRITFNYTETLNGSESLLGSLGGPMNSLLLAVIGCIMVYAFKNKKNLCVYMYFTITMCLTRLVSYVWVVLFGDGAFLINDEGIISKLLNIPAWQVYAFFVTLFVLILFFLTRIQKDCFYKCFKYACAFYFIISIFQIKIY